MCLSLSPGCVESLLSYLALRRGFLRWSWKERSPSLALCGIPLVMQVIIATNIKSVALLLQSSQWGNFCLFCLAAKNVIRCLLKVDPAHRITANELLDNPWISVRELHYSFPLLKWGHEYYRFRKQLISSLHFDGWLNEEPVRKNETLVCSKGDTSTAVTRTNVLEMMRQFRNAPEDEEIGETSEGLHGLSLSSSQDKGSGPRTSQELSVTPATSENVTDSSNSSKPSTPNKKVKKQNNVQVT